MIDGADPDLAREAQLALTFLSPPVDGFVITRVDAGSRAEQCGLELGDIIVRCAGRYFTSGAELRELMSARGTISLEVHRTGTWLQLKMHGTGKSGVSGAYRTR